MYNRLINTCTKLYDIPAVNSMIPLYGMSWVVTSSHVLVISCLVMAQLRNLAIFNSSSELNE